MIIFLLFIMFLIQLVIDILLFYLVITGGFNYGED